MSPLPSTATPHGYWNCPAFSDERATLGPASAAPESADLGEVTLEELTRALQDELRRGLVAAAGPHAASTRIPK